MNRYLLISMVVAGGLYSIPSTAQIDKENDSIPVELRGVEVFASYSNRAFDEPVMLSSLTEKEIESKVSNLEFPEILKFVPSTYVSRKGGGYGDSRITLRGFSSENVALTINGIPVNGAENGAVYWSNWAGLADVASAVQVQRGIGLSNRSIPSVGGTINILTLGAKAEKGGSLFYGIGNDGYEKMALTFSTGMIDGWNFTFSGSRTTGDGYVNGTNFEAWSYFAELSKYINDHHSLSLTVLGAPQWHNGGGYKSTIAAYDKDKDGIRMNKGYGYLNGKVVNTTSFGYNKYHKPQIALNHYWTINDRSSLMTSLYTSIAEGGGQKAYGLSHKTPDGLTDFEAAMKENASSENGSVSYLTMSTNAHDWYGLISTYSTQLTDDLILKAGFDGRYYKGFHYEEISDLLGGAYYLDTRGLAYRPTSSQLQVGDRINSDYVSYILQYGAFGELVYEKPQYKAFLTFAISDNAYQRKDKGTYGPYSDQDLYPESEQKTDWKHFVPVTLRGGLNYKLSDNHRVFVNGGYMTRTPKFENIYVSNNTPLSDLVMEKALTVEFGYGFHNEYLDVSLNGYYTRWYDKSTYHRPTRDKPNLQGYIPNIDAGHKGIELEVAYRPFRTLQLGGFFTLADWKWLNNVSYTAVDKSANTTESFMIYCKDLHVGDAPQTSAGINAEWEVFEGMKLAADFNYYARHYASFYPDGRTNPDDRSDSWKLPDYAIVDLRAKYEFQMGMFRAAVFGNVNNLFNKKYISDAQDGSNHERSSATVWYGFGRTWTTGLKLMF